jgi:hypothetical protein
MRKRRRWVRGVLVAVAPILFVPGLHGHGVLVDLVTAVGLGLIAVAVFPDSYWHPKGLIRWGSRNFILIYLCWGSLLAVFLSLDPEQSESHTPVDYLTYVGIWTLPVAVALIAGYLLFLALALDTWSGRPRLVAVGVSVLAATAIIGLTVLGRSHDFRFDIVVVTAFLVAAIAVRVATPRTRGDALHADS